MRVFDRPNLNNNWKCPVCNTNEDKPICLVSKYGTLKDGVIEVLQVHLDCIDLTCVRDNASSKIAFVQIIGD